MSKIPASLTLSASRASGAALVSHLTFVVETGPDVVVGAGELRKGERQLAPTIVQAFDDYFRLCRCNEMRPA